MSCFFRPGCLLLLLFFCAGIKAQTLQILPPFQPEQDACGAIPLCGNLFFTPYSYVGAGHIKDVDSTPCGGITGETNSMWMRIKILQPGTVVFTITPVSPDDDYDFAVFKQDISCERINGNQAVRCNFNNNNPGSNIKGVIGLSASATITEVPAVSFGNSFCKAIDAQAGETYLIMINNFGNYNSGGPSSGFVIDFSGSAAVFEPSPPPVIDHAAPVCSVDSLTIFFSNRVLCNTIASDGSDFSVSPGGSITSVESQNCNTANGYTQQLTIHFASQLSPGNYKIQVKKGRDQNTILDVCGTPIPLGYSFSFIVPGDLPANFMPGAVTKCNYAGAVLASSKSYSAYSWSNGSTGQSTEADKPGIYKLTVTDERGCRVQDSVLVKDSVCAEQFSAPNAFSPNGDGRNDYYHPIFKGAARGYHLAIYDRMGHRIFESQQPASSWDGRFHGESQPAGVYAWICDFIMNGQAMHRSGLVLLMR